MVGWAVVCQCHCRNKYKFPIRFKILLYFPQPHSLPVKHEVVRVLSPTERLYTHRLAFADCTGFRLETHLFSSTRTGASTRARALPAGCLLSPSTVASRRRALRRRGSPDRSRRLWGSRRRVDRCRARGAAWALVSVPPCWPCWQGT